jgi:hypothetical protein
VDNFTHNGSFQNGSPRNRNEKPKKFEKPFKSLVQKSVHDCFPARQKSTKRAKMFPELAICF